MKAVREHQLSFWDAMLWAAVLEAGVKVLVSEDFQHDRVLEDLRFCNPFVIENPLLDLFGSQVPKHPELSGKGT